MSKPTVPGPASGSIIDRMARRSASGDDQSFAALRSLARLHRGPIALANAMRVVAAVLPALHPYLLAELATSIDEPDRAGRFLALLFITGFAHFVLWTVADYYTSIRINPIAYEYKRLMFDTVWGEDYQRFVDRPSGKVASFVNDIRAHVAALWDSAHYGFLTVLATIPVYVVLLWTTARGNAFVYVVFLAAAGVVLALVAGPVNSRQRELTNNTATNTGRVFDSYANFVNVFSFRAHRKEIERNDEQLDGLIGDEIRFSVALSTYWAVASVLIRGVLWAAVMGFSWYQFDRGAISFTAMVVSVTVLLDFTNQYWNVVHHIGEWIDRSAAYREAYCYLFPGRNIVTDPPPERRGKPSESSDADVGPVAGRLLHSIEVRNLRFAYPDEPDRLVLDDVSFTVHRGERLGIVGRSGEGKSTLIKILLGFYRPTSGEVLVDGRPVEPEELAALQSYVPQDTSLFQETVEYNIGYAEPGAADPQRIRQAAQQANIADFIDSLPDGFQTLVGERGIKLSLGQRQRIAIARAFLKQSDLVILDEATSALDSETEARIQESLLQLWEGRAAIVIAHRLATLNDVHRIVVLEAGRVAEQGTKDELLANPGRFAEMWGLQRAGLN